MSNRIDAQIEFSFQGKNYDLSSTLDLDLMLEHHIALSSLHHAMAVEHGIDTYSYLFEVMQEEAIYFAHPQGRAVAYWQDGNFDFDGYLRDSDTQQLLAPLQAIASREMGVEDLSQHPQLKSALLCAYQLGIET
jgi:hypothetical protein